MKKRAAHLLLFLLCMGLPLAGCSGGQTFPGSGTVLEPAAPMQKNLKVAFVAGLINDAFYISVNRGLQNKAEEHGFMVLYQGATQWDAVQQARIIEGLTAKKVDMLIAAPVSARKMRGPLKKCAEAGIPVMTVDTDIEDSSFVTANITSDNFQGGEAAARALAGLIGSRGQIALINTNPGVTTSDARVEGFEEGLKPFREIELVSRQYCSNQPEKAAVQIQEILREYPALAGVFGTNLYSAIGISHGLKAKGVKIPIVCYDAGPTEIDSLRKGEISATVVQKPLAIGEIAGDYVYYFFSGQKDKIPRRTLVPSIVTTQENMNEPEISKWFYANGR